MSFEKVVIGNATLYRGELCQVAACCMKAIIEKGAVNGADQNNQA